MTTAVPEPKASENTFRKPPNHELLEAIVDELHIIKRLLEKPHACQSAPEVMDVLRMATTHTHSRLQSLAHEMRREAASGQVKLATPTPEETRPCMA